MSQQLDHSPKCLNCAEPLLGARFCGRCGQEHLARLHSMRALAGHYAEDVLSIDNKLFRSLGPLFAKPGKLTLEYLQGRRQSYVRPLRLYLLASIAFFAAFSFRYDPRDMRVGAQGLGSRDGTVAPPDSLTAAQAADALDAAGQPEPTITQDDDGTVHMQFGENTSGSVDLSLFGGLNSLPVIGPRLAAREAELEQMEPEELLHQGLIELMRHAPKAIFLIVPLVALMLKLLYARRSRFYMEHFVFALHWHTLIFLLLLFILYNPYTPLDLVLAGLAPLHLLFAMKRVYGQDWWRTIFKQQLLLWSYLFNVNVVLIVLAFLSALTI